MSDGPRFGRATEMLEEAGIVGYEQSREIAAEPIDWIWHGIIAAHHAVELCGASYSGKSTLAILLAVARANPTSTPVELLGRLVSPMADGKLVAIVNEENGRQSAVAKVDAAIEMLGLPARATWDRIALFSRAGLRAHDVTDEDVRNPIDGWGALLHAAEHGALDLIVLDTRARILGGFGSPKDEDAQALAAAAIVRLIEATGAPVLVVSHTRKGASEDIEDVSGSAQRGGGADTILMLQAEREEGRVLASKVVFIKLRDGVDEHPAPVSFSIARADDGRWRLSQDASARPEDKPAHERVFDLLAREELTQRQLRVRLKMSGERVREAVDVLKAEKRLQFRKAKVGGQETWLLRAKGGDDALLRSNGLLRSAHEAREGSDEQLF